MQKQTVLFKAPALIVLELTRTPAIPEPLQAKAQVVNGRQSLLLDAAAAEVLVSYLRVMRAFLSYLQQPKGQVSIIYGQVAKQLWDIMQQSGRSVAIYEDVSDLIKQLGCAHDWVQHPHALTHSKIKSAPAGPGVTTDT